MKLLFVTASLGLGGSEKCMAEMIRHLDLSRYEVTILALIAVENQHKFDPRIQIINGYPMFEKLNLPMRTFIKYAFSNGQFRLMISKSKYWFACRLGKWHLSKYFWNCLSKHIPSFTSPFDVVIGYGQGPATYFAIDKVPNVRGKLLWLNTDLEKANYDIEHLRRFYQSADAVAADSENGKRNLIRLYPEIKERVYRCTNMLDVSGILEQSCAYQPAYHPGKDLRILTVGRMAEAKALHLAVDAAGILKADGFSFKWYIVGDGSLRAALEEQIRSLNIGDHIVLLGAQSNPYPWFSQCDIYVQTSIYEGSCMTINEAMVFAKPIVTTNFPAAYEKIRDQENGLICEMTAEDIAAKVKLLLKNPKLREAISENLRQNPMDYEEQIHHFYDIVNRIMD